MGRNALEYARRLTESDPEIQAEYERLGPRYAVISQLVDARRRQKLTQKALGERVGVSQAVIARLESAEHSPKLDTLVTVAGALGCRVDVKLVRDRNLTTA